MLLNFQARVKSGLHATFMLLSFLNLVTCLSVSTQRAPFSFYKNKTTKYFRMCLFLEYLNVSTPKGQLCWYTILSFPGFVCSFV